MKITLFGFVPKNVKRSIENKGKVKMKYTEKEIELYGILAELFELNKKEIRGFFYYIIKGDKDTKRLRELLDIQSEMNGILKGLKIPKRFLILRKLDEQR